MPAAGHIRTWWGCFSGDTFTRVLALVSLAVSLLSLAWAVWNGHRGETIARCEKRTAAVVALSALHSSWARAELQQGLAIETMRRARPYTLCSNRADFDRLVAKVEEAAQLAKDAQKKEEEHLVKIWPTNPYAPPPPLGRLEATRAYAAHTQATVDDLPALVSPMLDLLKQLGTTPISCP